MRKKNTILCLVFLTSFCFAQNIQTPLKSNEAFLTEQSRIINSANFQSNQIVKKALKGEAFNIPKDWRLVNVLQDSAKGSGNNEYILFFQDSKSGVHTIGIQSTGLLSGNNLVFIPASE